MGGVFPEVQELDSAAYGLVLPQPYPWGLPEELPRNATSPALAASIVAMAGQGRLIGFTITNTKASAQFWLLFDLGSLPADGTVQVLGGSVGANSQFGGYFGSVGRWQREGIVLCNSSTLTSKTIGSADCIFDVQYVPQVI